MIIPKDLIIPKNIMSLFGKVGCEGKTSAVWVAVSNVGGNVDTFKGTVLQVQRKDNVHYEEKHMNKL